MARLDVAVKGLFATPVAAVELPGAERLNPLLVETILKRRAGNGSVQASNAGGWHSVRVLTQIRKEMRPNARRCARPVESPTGPI